MSNVSAQTASAPSGDAISSGNRRSRYAARRRMFLLGFLVVVVAAGAAANFNPLRHYQDARARLDKVTAQVAGLEDQKALLQAQLAKLSEAGYLEGLAREELTFARADEELYIVTEAKGGVGAAEAADAGSTAGTEAGLAAPRDEDTGRQSRIPSAGIGAGMPGADLLTGSGIGAMVPAVERSASAEAENPGLLERIVTAVANLF
jgi:cell division protein FtsB